jgi:hypothetical protein
MLTKMSYRRKEGKTWEETDEEKICESRYMDRLGCQDHPHKVERSQEQQNEENINIM